MPLKVLIIPDKFKGTLTALQAAEAIALGWKKSRPRDILELLPMSDGGDGFGEVLSHLLGAQKQTVATIDAAHRPLNASWWWDQRNKTAIIESAQVIGLAQLPPRLYHPFGLDTYGLGAVLRSASEHGARRCLIGIGGSATNDAGFGMARSMDWKFLTSADESIERWIDLRNLAHVQAPQRQKWFEEIRVAVDVRNPLLGVQGATRIYGPQKGLIPADFTLAERCLVRLVKVVKSDLSQDCSHEAGMGAAGGLGFGLHCFLGAALVPGFELFAQHADLERRVQNAQLVITGEGSIDASTLMGKGVGGLAELCHSHGIPCLGLGGVMGEASLLKTHFTDVHCLAPELTDATQAKEKPAYWLSLLASRVAKDCTL